MQALASAVLIHQCFVIVPASLGLQLTLRNLSARNHDHFTSVCSIVANCSVGNDAVPWLEWRNNDSKIGIEDCGVVNTSKQIFQSARHLHLCSRDNATTLKWIMGVGVQEKLLLKIITVSEWKSLLFVSDNPISGYLQGLHIIHLGCQIDKNLYLNALDILRDPKSDYKNIFIECAEDDVTDIIDWSCNESDFINWVVVNLPTNIPRFAHSTCRREFDRLLHLSVEMEFQKWLEIDTLSLELLATVATQLELKFCPMSCFDDDKRNFMPFSYVDRHLSTWFHSFHGQTLSISTNNYQPYFYYDENGHYHGMEYEIITTLAEVFNFKCQFHTAADGQWGNRGEDGTFNGMIGEVIRRDADLALSGISISEERQSAVDFTTPHWVEPNAVAIKLFPNKRRYFIDPFQSSTWLCWLCLPLVMSPFVILIAFSQRVGRPTRNLSIIDSVFSVFQILLSQSTEAPVFYSARILYISLWIFSVVICAIYSGNLTASLATQSVIWPFTSLDGLAANEEYSMTLNAGSALDALFHEATSGVYKKLMDKMKLQDKYRYENSSEAFELMMNSKVAYTGDYTWALMKVRRLHECSIVVLPEHFYPTTIGIVLPKGAVYKKHFDRVILALSQSGLLVKWYEQNLIHDTCSQTTDEAIILRFDDAVLVFSGVLGGGIALSLVCLAVEIILFKHFTLFKTSGKTMDIIVEKSNCGV